MQLTKPITVVVGILALGALIFNFYQDSKVSYLFGREINPWLYRAFWLVVVGICIYNYIYIDRNTLKNKSAARRGNKLKIRSRN
ncbi:hypothetical protein [Aequorivita echinoideorum]|uniref:Uncharacterized protein n=1 Tax=Aequorivita echinoideorum TaxID=1549647 RepID=A0ABS5S239_9FLAO|nr:hypothetical protein [Aequorivita echinoideorum]MBT0607256.1 hypothetical protein [Aequorivita echinoideorum]